MKKRRDRKRDSLKKGVYLLPNLCTTGSLFCGFYSIIKSLNAEYMAAAWAILAAGIFDMFDGRLARITRGSSQFGIEYDSLVDLASFGVAPSVLIYTCSLQGFQRFGWVAAFLFFACGALRLARFNCQIDSEESQHFQGLPIPMAAYMLATTVIFYEQIYAVQPKENFLVVILTIVLGVLMVSNIRYRSLKQTSFKERLPFVGLVVVLVLFVLVALKPPVMLWVVSLVYVLSGLVEAGWKLLFRKNRPVEVAASAPLTIVPLDQNRSQKS